MLTTVVALSAQSRAHALAQMLKNGAYAKSLDIVVLVGRSQLDAYLDGAGRIDILLIDTVLEPADRGLTGIELVAARVADEQDAQDTQVIYVTDRADHIMHVYKTRHAFCLLEPFDATNLNDALGRAIQNLRTGQDRPLGVRCDGRVRIVSPSRISFIESDRRKCYLHIDDEVLTTYATLDALAQVLPASFVRSHKSFLVNMRFIESIDSARVKLTSGELVPVSQKRRKSTGEAFKLYLRTA